MSWRRAILGGSLAAALSVGVPATAAAEFGPIELVSKSGREQAGAASEPAISADGRFVTFRATIGGRSAIFRRELAGGGMRLVAERVGAEAGGGPSISADGRYVAFTTAASLDPTADDPQPPAVAPKDSDVYVADMAHAPPAYEIASARDGCNPAASPVPCGLSYSSNDGSLAGVGIALSADGRRVAFVVNARSDLTGAAGGAETPPEQVALRDLATDSTILISTRRDPVTGMTEAPVEAGAVYDASGAALSADGTTVAWLGEHIDEQAPMLSDEAASVKALGSPYNEPLWRRVPSAADRPPTRRVVGGGDPIAPGCPRDGTLADPACQGPFNLFERIGDVAAQGWLSQGSAAPRLSADGELVALLGDPEERADVFLVDMKPGLSRREAMRQLTRWTNPAPELPLQSVFSNPAYAPFLAPIADLGISPDGRRIAYTTSRRFFPLAPPTLVSAQPAGLQSTELYQIDLGSETIERVTPGPEADVSLGGGASAPSYSADGRMLAFVSRAHNLVAGDANEGNDVFVVESTLPSPVGSSAVPAQPSRLVVRPRWRLATRAVSRPDGTVRVIASVPGAGTLRAKASAQLGPRLLARDVTAGRSRSRSARVLRLDLRLPPRLRAMARARAGLSASIRVSFAAPGREQLRDELPARFRVHRASEAERR
ncbi:MAG TPA: hypothetical protein VFI03_03200 [Solirubrobacterales bacterium]|nr:hypothetical protein [Solirubrobacterales bacterium]